VASLLSGCAVLREFKLAVDTICSPGVSEEPGGSPIDEQGRHRIHGGAKRWRAAQRAGLTEVAVAVRDTPTDPYTQVAENQKRHGLERLDLARHRHVLSESDLAALRQTLVDLGEPYRVGVGRFDPLDQEPSRFRDWR